MKKSKFTTIRALAAGTLLAAVASWAGAQTDYPNKPVRIIVPFSAGGGTDIFGRAVGQKLQERLGQTVLVENRPGAAGNLGADMVAKAPADGYTLLLAQDSLSIVPYLFKSLPFDVNKDFEPIGVGVFMPMVLVVSNKLQVNSVAELVNYAKTHPGKLSYGSPGNGTAHHLNFEAFLARTGTKMVHVPYKGAAPMMSDLGGGAIDAGFASISSALPLIQSNRIRAIAVADTASVPQLKDLPPIADSYPGYTAHVWFGLSAPKGTPKAITEKLSKEMRAALESPDLRERLTDLGYQVKPTTPAQMRKLMADEYDKWGKLIKTVGIEPNQ